MFRKLVMLKSWVSPYCSAFREVRISSQWLSRSLIAESVGFATINTGKASFFVPRYHLLGDELPGRRRHFFESTISLLSFKIFYASKVWITRLHNQFLRNPQEGVVLGNHHICIVTHQYQHIPNSSSDLLCIRLLLTPICWYKILNQHTR